nr:HAD family phosphatase [Schlegelella koreensis]
MFDLDHTLIPIDSDHAWNEFQIRLGWVDEGEFRRINNGFYADYTAGRLDIHAYIAFATAALRTRSAHELAEAHARFMREVVEPAIPTAARELVRAHQQRGDRVAIVTSTNDFVTAPIARAFGVAELIATTLERDATGTITGRIAGVASFREGKVTRVEAWLADQGLGWSDFGRISVYSDSWNDLPLLERATEPVAVSPSAELAAIASERGWRVLNLFE